jgi:hypothetical protein
MPSAREPNFGNRLTSIRVTDAEAVAKEVEKQGVRREIRRSVAGGRCRGREGKIGDSGGSHGEFGGDCRDVGGEIALGLSVLSFSMSFELPARSKTTGCE